MKKTLLLLVLFAGASGLFAQFSIGIRIGPPPRPRVVRVQPRSPGADYSWVDGYWYPSGRRYAWHGGYWSRPPYAGASWTGPHYAEGQYFDGYWQGGGRQMKHEHGWDKNKKNRDYGRNEGRGHE